MTEESEKPLTPVAQEENAGDGLTPAAEKAILSEIRMLISRQSFSGPMPPPECLRQYDQIVPGAAKDIFEEFKMNGAHQRAMDQTILKASSDRDRRAQWMACGLVFLGFILIMALAWTNHDWVAAAVAGTLLGAVVTGFLQGKKANTAQPSPADETPSD